MAIFGRLKPVARLMLIDRAVGRYWRIGFFNGCPVYMQEKTEFHCAEDSQGLMLLFLEGTWWICLPGWGKCDTEWLGRSNWPEMLDDGLQQEGYQKTNLEAQGWFVPWDGPRVSGILKCAHGQAWLHDCLKAMHMKDMQGYNELLAAQASASTPSALEPALKPTPKAEGKNAGRGKGSSSSSGEADRGEKLDGGDGPDGDELPDGDDDGSKWQWRPKAGSLNHKVALIGAYQMRDWSRMKQLIQVLLAIMILYVM